jgi:hypothetical protein
MDLNLDSLKGSISEHLERSDFAIFRHDPGVFDANLVVTWDSETYPDFQMFLDAARKLGVRMILFAAREFDASELTEAEEELEESEMPREDKREYAKTMQGFRQHAGSTCSIELAFHFETHFYLYEVRADWYEDFVGISDEVIAFGGAGDDEVDSEDGMGGFYSKN